MNDVIYKKIAISNRRLLTGGSRYTPTVRQQLLDRIALIARNHLADAVILREKDLTLLEYQDLADAAVSLCKDLDFPLILHHFVPVAEAFSPGLPLHLSMPDFLKLRQLQAPILFPLAELHEEKYGLVQERQCNGEEKRACDKMPTDKGVSGSAFSIIGVSTHTVEEALEAERLGASYITASHIFPTACKEGLPPRGLDYLREVCEAVSIPVYALGGVHEPQIEACLNAGAAGVCMMSEYFMSTL